MHMDGNRWALCQYSKLSTSTVKWVFHVLYPGPGSGSLRMIQIACVGLWHTNTHTHTYAHRYSCLHANSFGRDLFANACAFSASVAVDARRDVCTVKVWCVCILRSVSDVSSVWIKCGTKGVYVRRHTECALELSYRGCWVWAKSVVHWQQIDYSCETRLVFDKFID